MDKMLPSRMASMATQAHADATWKPLEQIENLIGIDLTSQGTAKSARPREHLKIDGFIDLFEAETRKRKMEIRKWRLENGN